MEIDDNLKGLIKDLGNAINGALSESTDINEAIKSIRNAGFEVVLALEVTIGFSRKDSEGQGPDSSSSTSPEGKLKVTSQDLKFLQSLKISIEDLNQR